VVGFCPNDRRPAEGLLQLHREIEVGYCRLVTITTNNITQTNERISQRNWGTLALSLRFPSHHSEVSRHRGIHRPLHNPMIPHVIVVEPGLVVHNIYNGYWFFGRPTREELRAVSKKCRPDRDITTPELKAALRRLC
jgi:hypothetical protein